MARFTSVGGGEPGPQGPAGPAGSDAPTDRIYSGNFQAIIDSSGNTTFDGQLLPSVDNLYTVGTEERRWKGMHLGPSSLNLTENEGDTVTLSTQGGILYVNGADLIRIGNMNFTNTGIESAITTQDITIGNTGDTGYLSTARGIKFPDDSVQTTAQIQSDWTQTDDTELDYIKNKPTLPDLSGYGVPVSYNPVWSGTGLTYTGTPATGSYMKMGKLVNFRVKVLMTTVTNFGTGDYSLTLPFVPVANYAFRDGGLHDGAGHYSVVLDADPSNTTGKLYYNTSNGQDARFNHNSPKTLSTTDYFYISGTYECV